MYNNLLLIKYYCYWLNMISSYDELIHFKKTFVCVCVCDKKLFVIIDRSAK